MAAPAEQVMDSPASPGFVGRKPPPPIPPPRRVRTMSAPAIFSTFLMNDIPRGTTHAKLAQFLLAQSPNTSTPHDVHSPQVVFGSDISDSRLDDDLSVATLEFSATPSWLLNQDASCFPKHTGLGTIWRGADLRATDEHGRTEFMRAVIGSRGSLGPLYAEMLAEFPATDINAQDDAGRTALHWACAAALPDMIALCLSIAQLDTGLRDARGLTAFDLAMRSGDEFLPGLFYASLVETEQRCPQAALLRVLTLSAAAEEESAERAVFPGEALFQPVGERNCPLVVALLARGVDLTARDEDGNTALHLAAGQVGGADIATRLIDAGSDVNAVGSAGSTPLIAAVRTGDAEMVRLLLRRKADIAIADEDEMPALHWAAQRGEVEIARVLLAEGADGAVRDGFGRTAGDVAEANRSIEVVELLDGQYQRGETISVDSSEILEGVEVQVGEERMPELAPAVGSLEEPAVPNSLETMEDPPVPHPPKVDFPVTNPDAGKDLLAAARQGDSELVRKLVERGVDIEYTDSSTGTALHCAVWGGKSEIIAILLAAGANANAAVETGRTPLHRAALFGYSDIINALLAAGADIESTDAGGDKPLHCAMLHRSSTSVSQLLAAGAQVDAKNKLGITPLALAITNEYADHVKTLLAAGADTEVADEHGNKPLHIATSSGQVGMVQALVARADINSLNGRGDTSLHIAVGLEYYHIVEVLLVARADTEMADKGGNKPLHIATSSGQVGMVQALVARADINSLNGRGDTSLHIAVRLEYHHIVEVLLVARADTEMADKGGNKPLHIATRSRQVGMVQALVARADINSLNGRGDTALHIAVRLGNHDIVKVLLAARVVANQGGNKLLHIATGSGQLDIELDMVQALVAGVNINSLNGDGDTALHIAIGVDQQVMNMLLRAGASTKAQNSKGKSVYQVALEGGDPELVRRLRTHTDVTHRMRSDVLYRLSKTK